jgi:hypothetical protein
MLTANGFSICEESIRPIAWSHWKRVLKGNYPLHGKATAAARAFLRLVLPLAWYRRLFVVNYNALCESTYHFQDAESLGQLAELPVSSPATGLAPKVTHGR